ncbi:MAG TPA: alpha-isopropylmalate synthase regulatory domain-containing protein, partial [Moraxellaceae bacterium]|nr:alpha-isopropylmalate synthase regulatory domain-containing protein [Moraxellaceae bacterium]
RDFGITLPRWMQVELSRVVQAEAEAAGGEIDSFTIRRLFEHHFLSVPEGMRLRTYGLNRDHNGVQATVEAGDESGTLVLQGHGQGAVEALAAALAQRFDVRIEVEAYEEFAVEGGTGADALACLRLAVDGTPYSAAALAADTTTAVLQAVLTAVGRHGVTAAAVAEPA